MKANETILRLLNCLCHEIEFFCRFYTLLYRIRDKHGDIMPETQDWLLSCYLQISQSLRDMREGLEQLIYAEQTEDIARLAVSIDSVVHQLQVPYYRLKKQMPSVGRREMEPVDPDELAGYLEEWVHKTQQILGELEKAQDLLKKAQGKSSVPNIPLCGSCPLVKHMNDAPMRAIMKVDGKPAEDKLITALHELAFRVAFGQLNHSEDPIIQSLIKDIKKGQTKNCNVKLVLTQFKGKRSGDKCPYYFKVVNGDKEIGKVELQNQQMVAYITVLERGPISSDKLFKPATLDATGHIVENTYSNALANILHGQPGGDLYDGSKYLSRLLSEFSAPFIKGLGWKLAPLFCVYEENAKLNIKMRGNVDLSILTNTQVYQNIKNMR